MISDECEDQLARLSWADGVPAPVDADGRLVPLRTEKLYTDDGEEFSVSGFSYLRDEKAWVAREVRKRSKIICAFELRRLQLRRLHLHKPDSWEKLEEDIGSIKDADCPCDYFNHSGCVMSCDSCPAHTVADDCVAELARDVLRRAKSLARRDAKASTPQPSPHEPEEVN